MRSEVGGSTAALRAEINQRMDRVETGVTAQLEKTLERLTAINNQQQEQQRTVEAMQGEQYSMNARLQALESKEHVLQTTGTSSTADTDFGGRKPDGGWGDDTPAEETLNNVKQMVKDLRLDIPTDQAFVPGVRRGYAILPYGAKEGEDQQQLRERLSTALRQANIQMGTHADGKAKYLWLQLSQSPERRRRVQLAGKCKRLCLTLGATLSQVETEWPTGTVWLRGVSHPAGGSRGGRSWLDQCQGHSTGAQPAHQRGGGGVGGLKAALPQTGTAQRKAAPTAPWIAPSGAGSSTDTPAQRHAGSTGGTGGKMSPSETPAALEQAYGEASCDQYERDRRAVGEELVVGSKAATRAAAAGKGHRHRNAFQIAALVVGILDERAQRGDPPTQGELAEVMELTQSGQALLWGGKRSSNWQRTHDATATDAAEDHDLPGSATQPARRSGGRRGSPGGATHTGDRKRSSQCTQRAL